MKKKRSFILILLILTVVCFTAVLSACVVEKLPDPIEPTEWQAYINEVLELVAENYSFSDKQIFADTKFNLQYYDEKQDKSNIYEATFKMNFSTDKYSSENALVFEIYKQESTSTRNKLFALYGNNNNLYLYNYSNIYDKTYKYHYENAPIFSLMEKFIVGGFDNKTSVIENLISALSKTITNCTVNSKKTIYTFDLKLGELLHTLFFSQFSDLLDIMPKSFTDSIYGLLEATDKAEFENIFKSATCQLKVNVSNKKITSYQLENILINDQTIKLRSIEIPTLKMAEEPILGLKLNMPNDYEKVKIGTANISGKLNVTERITNEILVPYDIEINTSLDLLQLLNNNFDLRSLDEDNYFHFRLSHKCNDECGEFCSVELGNKYNKSNGAIFDLAFSPKHFGSNKIYLSVSIKALLGENNLPYIEGLNKSLFGLTLADYQLLVFDPNVSYKGVGEESQNTVVKKVFFDIFKILKIANVDGTGANFNISDISTIFSIIFGEESGENIKIINDILQSLQAENFKFEINDMQYGTRKTYDVKKKAIYVVADKVEEGYGTKQYNNYLLGKDIGPALDWKFNSVGISENKFIHNLFSVDNQLVYGVQDGKVLPISGRELDDLIGGSIQLSYTDILGNTTDENGEPLLEQCKILGIENVDYSNTKTYQTIRLKVGNPSNLFATSNIEKEMIVDFLNEYMYIYVDIDIKLTPLANIKIEYEENKNIYRISEKLDADDYLNIVGANVTYSYADGSKKTIMMSGTTPVIINAGEILGKKHYAFCSYGKHYVSYSICGEKYKKTITIEKPDEYFLNVAFDEKYVMLDEQVSLSACFPIRFYATYYNDDGTQSKNNFLIGYDNIYIDGKLLYAENDNFELYFDGFVEYIKFNKEGNYHISAEYMGEKVEYTIVVGTEDLSSSEYKLTCKTNVSDPVIMGQRKTIMYWLDNLTHGSSGLGDRKVFLDIKKMSSSGSYEEISENDAQVNSFTVDDGSVKKDMLLDPFINLPAMIYEPYIINYALTFGTPGYYKIRLYVGSIQHLIDLQVITI